MQIGLNMAMQRGAQGARFSPLDLFGPSDNGFYFDFSKTDRTFQEATAITPADDATEPVALALSERLWGGKTFAEVMAAQPELVNSVTGVVGSTYLARGTSAPVGDGYYTVTGDNAIASVVASIDGLLSYGKFYEVIVTISAVSGGVVTLHLSNGQNSGVLNPSILSTNSVGTHRRIVTPDVAGRDTLSVFCGTTGLSVTFKISVKEIPGNHAIQSVATGRRPTRQAGGILRWDGVDDYLLTSSLPSAAISMFIKGVCGISRVFMGSRTGNSDDIELLIAASGGIGANAADTFAIGTNDIRGVTGTYGLTLDASYLRVWEGSLLAAETAASGTINTTVPIMIGARNTSGTGTLFLTGDIHKALVINRALTQAEIASLVNAWS